MNKLWEDKAKKLSVKVKRIARGDDDCYQQGMLGIRNGLLKDPCGTDSFLLESAKFAMLNYKNKGKSVDNGSKYPTRAKLLNGEVKTYKKEITIVYIDQMDLSDVSCLPDADAIDRICADNFYQSLNAEEIGFINAYSINRYGNFSDKKTRIKMGISISEYNRIKNALYQKFIKAF